MPPNHNSSSPECPQRHDCRKLNRREFIAVGSGCVLAAVAKAAEKPQKKLAPVDIGPLEKFSKDGILEEFTGDDFFVIRHQNQLFAASTKCPHMGHALRVDPNNSKRIICGSHDAVFDPDGTVVVGPAATGLIRHGISVNEKGNVIVDRNKKFPQDKWTEDGNSLFVE
ncbi:MAG: Rieske (2Fe-2S) protein [Verrucomicrobia bacterium]|nr:Rieske (2Fe-2S) protein [Verrucomicrobiota bacterium]